MKNILLVLTILLFAASYCAAETKFKDLPDNHWASSSVYTSVKMGLMNGYPDGTFRGNKPITRYEVSSIVSKMADRAGTTGLKKLSEELKMELKAIKSEIARMSMAADSGTINGSYEQDIFLGNLLAGSTTTGQASKGPAVYYRLITGLKKYLSDDASVKITLDTMDSGFLGGVENISTRLFDVQAKLKGNIVLLPFEINASSGPGPQVLASPSDIYQGLNGYIYWRPWNSVSMSTEIGALILNGSYVAHNVDTVLSPGKVGSNQLRGFMTFGTDRFPILHNLQVNIGGDYFYVDASTKYTRGEINFKSTPVEKIGLTAMFAAGGSDTQSMAVAATFSMNDYFNSGTNVLIKAAKYGSTYLRDTATFDSWWITGNDVFGRTLPVGIVNIGADITQSLSEKLAVRVLGDVRLSGNFSYGKDKPNSSMTYEGDILYSVTQSLVLKTSYMIFFNPTLLADSSSDLLTLGLKYNF